MKDQNFISRYYTNAVQSAFARIRLKDYFETLDELSENKGFYRYLYSQIKEYSRLDDNGLYDFYRDENDDTPLNEDVTVGEILYAASEAFKCGDKVRRDSELYDDYEDDGSRQEAAGRMIVTNVVILPLSDNDILTKIETMINGKEISDL